MTGRRIIDMLRPGRVIVGRRAYLFARWQRLRTPRPGLSDKQAWALIDRGVRGWRPGGHRLAGMRAERRIINPAVRFMPVTRQYNEIIKVRRKQGAYPPLPWPKKKPSR